MTRDDFERLAHKGPVRGRGSNQIFHDKWRIVEPHLLAEERSALLTARSHNIDEGRGRGEWDAVVKQVRARLFPEG